MRAAGMAMGVARAESELFCYFLVITLLYRYALAMLKDCAGTFGNRASSP